MKFKEMIVFRETVMSLVARFMLEGGLIHYSTCSSGYRFEEETQAIKLPQLKYVEVSASDIDIFEHIVIHKEAEETFAFVIVHPFEAETRLKLRNGPNTTFKRKPDEDTSLNIYFGFFEVNEIK